MNSLNRFAQSSPRRSVDRILAKRHLLDFTTFTKPDYLIGEHHRILCRHLDRLIAGQCKRLMVFMPPRSGKSELVSRRLPAKILGDYPDADIIACSYSADLASRMNRDVQRIIDSPEFHSAYPGTTLNSSNVRSNAKGQWLRNNDIFEVVGHRGVYRSAGVGGGITGMGFTFGIIDDPVKNAEEANSPTIREKVWEWYTSTFLTRQGPDARILLTLTRWHDDDLAGRLLKLQASEPDADKWEVLTFPAIAEEKRHPEDWRQPGESIWPERKIFSLPSLASLRAALGDKQYAAIYQQSPRVDGGNHFKEQWFLGFEEWNHRKPGDAWLLHRKNGQREPVMKADCTIFVIVDPAASEKQSADFTAIGVFAVTPMNDLLVLHMVRERLGVAGIVPKMLEVCREWYPQWVGLEANGFQVYIASDGRKRDGAPPIRELTHAGKGKLVRATPAIIRCESGQVYVPIGAPWRKVFIDECIKFTGLDDAHDDQVDVLAYAGLEMDRLGIPRSNPDEFLEQLHSDLAPGYESDAADHGLWGR